VKVPATVTILAGQTTGAFTATVASSTSNLTAQLTASYNGSSQSFTLSATAPAQLSSLSITSTVLATGVPISSTSPGAVAFGDGSLWVSYQNGADSAGAGGSSTVVRYSSSGVIFTLGPSRGTSVGCASIPVARSGHCRITMAIRL
jgi:hypothetical protein